MSSYLRYNTIIDNPLYNCSAIESSQITLLTGEKQVAWGVIGSIYGTIVQLLHICSLCIIGNKRNYVNPCYKIMFYMGISDICTVFINCHVFGSFLIAGVNFCDWPNTIYLAGVIGIFFWYYTCMSCLLLVINRLLDSTNINQQTIRAIFGGHKTHFLLFLIMLYSFSGCFFFVPPIFNSRLGMAFWNPFVFANKEEYYVNNFHIFNNYGVVLLSCFFYALFCIAISNRFKSSIQEGAQRKKLQNQVFLQSTVLCIVNFMAALFYIVANLVYIPPQALFIVEMSYQATTGAPALIYLLMNRTIRLGVRDLFMRRSSKITTRTLELSQAQRSKSSHQ